MPDLNQEALFVWNAMQPTIDKEIDAMTKGMVQRRKATVTTAPQNSLIGVTEPFGQELMLPYLSNVATASVGDLVWIEFVYGMSNAFVSMFVNPDSKKQVIRDYVTPQMFGATGDGTTDDTDAINDMFDFAISNKKSVLFPKVANGYFVSVGIIVETSVNIIMESPIIYDGLDTALTLGKTTGTFNYVYVFLKVKATARQNGTVGIKLINMANCEIHVDRSDYYATGLMILGASGQGFVYNEIHLGIITDADVAVHLNPQNSGWVNENVFYSGRLWARSTSGISGVGVLIAGDGSTIPNNNVFIKPSVEQLTKGFRIEHGYNNTVYSARTEGTTVGLECVNDSANNVVYVGYGNTTYSGNSNNNNIISLNYDAGISKLPYTVQVSFYGGAGVTTNDCVIQDAAYFSSSTSSYAGWVQNAEAKGSYVELKTNGNIGMCVTKNEGEEVDVRLGRQYAGGTAGRFLIALFDANGNILSDLKYDPLSLRFSTNHYESMVDLTGGVAFTLPSDCVTAYFGLFNGSQVSKPASIEAISSNPLSLLRIAPRLYSKPTYSPIEGTFVISANPSDDLAGWIYKNGSFRDIPVT